MGLFLTLKLYLRENELFVTELMICIKIYLALFSYKSCYVIKRKQVSKQTTHQSL